MLFNDNNKNYIIESKSKVLDKESGTYRIERKKRTEIIDKDSYNKKIEELKKFKTDLEKYLKDRDPLKISYYVKWQGIKHDLLGNEFFLREEIYCDRNGVKKIFRSSELFFSHYDLKNFLYIGTLIKFFWLFIL